MRDNPYGQINDGGWCGCASCGRRLTGLTAFDAHHVPVHEDGSPHRYPGCKCSEWDYRCLSDDELEARGLAPNTRGWWGSDKTRPTAAIGTRSGRTESDFQERGKGMGAGVGSGAGFGLRGRVGEGS